MFGVSTWARSAMLLSWSIQRARSSPRPTAALPARTDWRAALAARADQAGSDYKHFLEATAATLIFWATAAAAGELLATGAQAQMALARFQVQAAAWLAWRSKHQTAWLPTPCLLARAQT